MDDPIINSQSWRHIFMVFYGTPATYPIINSFQDPIKAVRRLREIDSLEAPKLICYTSTTFHEGPDLAGDFYVSRFLSVSDETIDRLEKGEGIKEMEQAARDELVAALKQNPHQMHLVESGCVL